METYEEACKRYEEYHKKIVAEVNALIENVGHAELEKRFFKDYGCINFRDDDYMHEVNLAREYHRQHTELFPHLHDKHEIQPYNCYHQTVCKCGYSEAYDSGD